MLTRVTKYILGR